MLMKDKKETYYMAKYKEFPNEIWYAHLERNDKTKPYCEHCKKKKDTFKSFYRFYEGEFENLNDKTSIHHLSWCAKCTKKQNEILNYTKIKATNDKEAIEKFKLLLVAENI